jgi:beta-glucosidase-like glycosyl hydrolase
MIFSDDLSMQAARDQEPNPAKRVSRAFNAGIDYALVCNNPGDIDLILNSMEFNLVIEGVSPKINMRLDRSKHQSKTFQDQSLSEITKYVLKMTN